MEYFQCGWSFTLSYTVTRAGSHFIGQVGLAEIGAVTSGTGASSATETLAGSHILSVSNQDPQISGFEIDGLIAPFSVVDVVSNNAGTGSSSPLDYQQLRDTGAGNVVAVLVRLARCRANGPPPLTKSPTQPLQPVFFRLVK